MHIPDSIVQHVMRAGASEARLCVNKISGNDPNWPGLIFVCNAIGAAQLLELVKVAVEHAPDPDTKEAWRALGLQMASAAQGALTS